MAYCVVAAVVDLPSRKGFTMLYAEAYERWQSEMVPLTEYRKFVYDQAAKFVTPLWHMSRDPTRQEMARLLCSTEQSGVVLVESAKHTGPHTDERNCPNFGYYNFALYETLRAALTQQEPTEAVSLILEDVYSPLPPTFRGRPSQRTVESTLTDYCTTYVAKTRTARSLLDLVMSSGTNIVLFQSLTPAQ